MALNLKILYRGPLSSCNYGCNYCPFAKRRETKEQHQTDAVALERFLNWVEGRPEDRISVFFTPWGEALIQRRYQQALVRLTQMPQVQKAAIQTNGSCRFDWVEGCDKSKLGLWVTYHPTQTSRDKFLARCDEMRNRGLRFSVGVVGIKEHFAEIEALRAALPEENYVWVNAYKRINDYYSNEEIDFLTAIDTLFPFNNQYHSSQNKECRTGESVISVDGDGTIRRCHFVKNPIGNIYQPEFEKALFQRPCENEKCGCHIGYIHMPELKMYEKFGDGILERIPVPNLAPAKTA